MIVEAEVIDVDYNGHLMVDSKGRYYRADWPETRFRIGSLVEISTTDPYVSEIT